MTVSRYEHAYIDPAQVGSRCQRLAGGLSSKGELQVRAQSRSRWFALFWARDKRHALQVAFEVLYGNTSFEIIEDYASNPDASVLGAYNKTVEEPFGKLLRLPTVFVNVTDDGAGPSYDFAIM
jgi:hypothetical protein